MKISTEELVQDIYNPATDPKTLNSIFEKTIASLDTRIALTILNPLARHKNTSPETLKKIFLLGERESFMYIAANKNTPTDILQDIFQQASDLNIGNLEEKQMKAGMLNGLAGNPNTPTEILQKIFQQANDLKGENPLEKQMKAGILSRLAANPNTPTAVLQDIFNQAKDLNIVDVKEKQMKAAILSGLAGNPNTPTAILETLLTNSIVFSDDKQMIMEIFAKLASNPNTTPQNLEIVFNLSLPFNNDQKAGMLNGLAGNPNTPTAVLQDIFKQAKDLNIRDAKEKQMRIEIFVKLADHANTPAAVLQDIFKQAKDFKIPEQELFQKLANNKNFPQSILYSAVEEAFFVSYTKGGNSGKQKLIDAFGVKLDIIDAAYSVISEAVGSNMTLTPEITERIKNVQTWEDVVKAICIPIIDKNKTTIPQRRSFVDRIMESVNKLGGYERL